jgi:hypothetical protein
VPRRETRTLRHDDLVRRVIAHHKAKGELVDFWLMKGGAIVGHYRVRPDASVPWTDLLPTGASAERYQRTIQRLAPILFPEAQVTIKAIGRGDAQVTVEVELPD